MRKLLAIAALLLASTAAQAQYTFEYGGRTIRVDPDRGTVSIPGVYDNTGRRTTRSRNDQDSDRPRKSAPQQAKGDPQAPARWIAQLSHLRPGISRLDSALTLAQLLGADAADPSALLLGQFPETANDRWLGLKLDPANPPARGRVAFACVTAGRGFSKFRSTAAAMAL